MSEFKRSQIIMSSVQKLCQNSLLLAQHISYDNVITNVHILQFLANRSLYSQLQKVQI